jgi:multicomponent Na+:H+ antiporter subunit D
MSSAASWSVLIPLAGAATCVLVGSRAARWIAAVAIIATAGAVAAVVATVAMHGPVHVAVGGWSPPLGIALRADGLAAAMLATIAIVAAVLGCYVIGRRPTSPLASRFFALWLFAWAALDALVLSNDIFNLYVTLELVTLAAVGLIAIGAERPALRAALRYLLFALPGALLYLLGVAMLYGTYGTLDVAQLGTTIASTPHTWMALSLITVGLALKAALFPLHAWLPPAYASSRPVVSALLAGLIGKAAFLVLGKLWWHLFPHPFASAFGPLLGVLGTGAILWGSVVALRQTRLKLVIAYSSVAQIGYLFMAFALHTPSAWSGAVYVAIAHALAAPALFIAAGTLERATGRDDLDNVQGLAERFPLALFAIALAAISLMAMPPTGGFIGKWLLVRVAIETGHVTWAVVMVVGGLLAAGYMFRILRRVFLPMPPIAAIQPQSRGSEIVALGLALLGIVLGIAPWFVLELIAIGGVR